MFELETALSNWKQSLVTNGSVIPEQARELEEHLRESLTNLLSLGLSQREAFIVAADRLGHPSALGQEYAKVNLEARWRRPVLWMLAGYIGMRVASSTVSVVTTIAGTTMAFGGAGGTAAGIVMISLMAMVWTGMATLVYRHRESLGNCVERLPARWLSVAGIMLIAAPVIFYAGWNNVVRTVDPSWIGETSLYLNIGRGVTHILVVAFCLAAMWKFGVAAKQTRMESV